MTSATETSPEPAGSPLGAAWRAQMSAVQESAAPEGRTVVSCPAPFGGGGLGRHLKEIVEALERRGHPPEVISESPQPPPPPKRGSEPRAHLLAAAARLPARVSAAWRIWAASVEFDAFAAERLPAADHLMAFNGTALLQLRRARSERFASLSLIAANSHFRHVLRQHARAHAQYPLEAPWSTHLLRRNLSEYAQVDRLLVASSYVRESFLAEGFPEERLSLFPLTPDPRFRPRPGAPAASTFDVVYVGSLTVHKGVPLLIDAFRRLRHQDIRLVLIGGWKTRAMRRFIERTCAEDRRIEVRPGDPLARLQAARLCVHAAYEDGFAYAPAEALACGVPVIVSEDTGMKDLIESRGGGLILPTGDRAALSEAIDAAYRGEAPVG